MRKRIFFLLTVIFILIFCITICSFKCTKTSDKKTIVCTTTMITDTVKNIVGDRAYVQGLMGPGVDPHLYRATEGDVQRLASADLVFYNGLHLEGKMAEILERMNNYAQTYAVAECINTDELIPSEFDDIYDPHVWHDVRLWIQVVSYICDVLSTDDPDYAVFYEQNAAAYITQLKALDAYVKNKAERCPVKIIITAHDAFAYFGRAYGFEVIGLQGISTDSQISTHDITHLVKIIIEHRIPAIFLESSIPTRAIQAVQQAVRAYGHKLAIAPELFSDALSDSSCAACTYHGMINHNINTMTTALNQ